MGEERALDTNNKAYRVWMDQLNTRAKTTRFTYLRWFNLFLEQYKIPDAETLYRMKLEDLKSEDSRDRLRVESMAKTMMHEKVKQGYKPKTAAHLNKALKSFFTSQNLPFSIRPSDMPKGESVGLRLILKEQIARVYDSVGAEYRLRNRALILVAKDSGLRISDIAALTVGSYRNAETRTNSIGEQFKVFDPIQTQKCKINAFVHLGPESVKAIDSYLSERDTPPSDSPIFVDRDCKAMNIPAVSEQFRRLCKHVKGVKRLGAHSFRKFHTTQLEGAGLSPNWIARLQGKKLEQSMGPYSHLEETGELTQAYITHYDRLRLFGEADVARLRREMEETKAQTSKVAELEARNTAIEAKLKASEELQREILKQLAALGKLEEREKQ